jgi:hypothetical protein
VAQISACARFGQVAPEESHQLVARLRIGLQGEVGEECACLDRFQAHSAISALEFTAAEQAQSQPGFMGRGCVHAALNALSTLICYLDDSTIGVKRKIAELSTPNLPRYRAYLLRLWQEQTASSERAAIWRTMLEDPKTGQRRGFDGLDSLLAFLRAEIGETHRGDHKESPNEEEQC